VQGLHLDEIDDCQPADDHVNVVVTDDLMDKAVKSDDIGKLFTVYSNRQASGLLLAQASFFPPMYTSGCHHEIVNCHLYLSTQMHHIIPTYLEITFFCFCKIFYHNSIPKKSGLYVVDTYLYILSCVSYNSGPPVYTYTS